MDDLNLEDIEGIVVKTTPVDFMGKRAYIRHLTFDGQVLIHRRFGDKLETDATPDDMRTLLCLVLCDVDGNLFFQPRGDETLDAAVARGVTVLAKVDGDEMQEVFAVAKTVNGWSVDEEIKNSKAAQPNS